MGHRLPANGLLHFFILSTFSFLKIWKITKISEETEFCSIDKIFQSGKIYASILRIVFHFSDPVFCISFSLPLKRSFAYA